MQGALGKKMILYTSTLLSFILTSFILGLYFLASNKVRKTFDDVRMLTGQMQMLRSDIVRLQGNIAILKNEVLRSQNSSTSYEYDFRNLNQKLNSYQSKVFRLRNDLARGYSHLPLGWITPFNGYQYKATPKVQGWKESFRSCREMGGELAAHGVQDWHTRRVIFNALSIANVWIGLRSYSVVERWRWTNGEAATSDNIAWFSYCRNRKASSLCAHMFPFTCMTNCSTNLLALCEKPLPMSLS